VRHIFFDGAWATCPKLKEIKMLFGQKSVLMEEENPGGGGGTSVSMEDVNKAINGALARFGKDELPKSIKAAVTEATKPFTTQFENIGTALTGITEKLGDGGGSGGAGGGTGGGAGGNKGGAGGGTEGDDGMTPAARAKFANIEKLLKQTNDRLETTDKAREAAELKAKVTEKNSAIKQALSALQFTDPGALDDAFAAVAGQIDFDPDSGELIGNGLPVAEFVKGFIEEKKPYLLAPVNKGGAGAGSGNRKGGTPGTQFEDIRPGMTAQQSQKTAQDILAAMGVST